MPNKESKVTKRDLMRVMWRYIFTFQWSWNYERMQALGFAWSILPVLEKVYDTKEGLIRAVQRHLNFFNTQPHVGAAIMGAAAALEEEGAGGDAVDSLKVGLMGPFAGIGDTLYAILTRPIIGVFAASAALAGSWVGVWLMIAFGLFWSFAVQIPFFWSGYRQGVNVVSEVGGTSGRLGQLTEGATIMGLIVIGGFVPSILARVTTPLTFVRTVEVEGVLTEKVIGVQSVLDQLLPFMIPILLVGFVYWMLQGLKWSPIKALLVLAILSFAGSLTGIL